MPQFAETFAIRGAYGEPRGFNERPRFGEPLLPGFDVVPFGLDE
jgi:hypothetical protein